MIQTTLPANESKTSSEALMQCPYRGLIPYSEADARFFFGREDWCRIILNNLLATPLTLLYGSSGVGKSSVLRAGVASKLKAEGKESVARSGSAEHLVVVCRDWRDDPLATLRNLIRQEIDDLLGHPLVESQAGQGTLGSLLKDCTEAMRQADVEETNTGGKVLLILDQFEEYFLYHPNEEGPGCFAEEFPQAVNDMSLPLHVLISLREDSLAKLDYFKAKIPNLFANRLRIEHLDRNAAIDAILNPIQEFNRHLPEGSTKASVEPRLVQDVLEQVRVGQINEGEFNTSEQPSSSQAQRTESLQVETPFLQLVMTRLWEEEIQTAFPPRLRQETLSRLGGGATIVREHLQRLMQDLPDSSKRVAAIIFDKLVTTGLTKIAYPVYELTDPSKVDRPEDLLNREQLSDLLATLSGGNQRILRRLPPSLERPNGEDRYEIYHDVLAKPILEWRRAYTQESQLNKERQQHAQELKLEQQRRRKIIGISLSVGGTLLGFTVWLGLSTYSLQVKEKELNVIESAQQFKIQQLDQLDALIQALAAAQWLQQRSTQKSPGAARDVGANLRHILDNIRERFKATILTEEERRRNPLWIAKIRLNQQAVAILSRNGSFVLRDFQGQPQRLPAKLEAMADVSDGHDPSNKKARIKSFALSDAGGYIATLSKLPKGDNYELDLWGAQDSPIWSDRSLFVSPKPNSNGSRPASMMRNRLAFSPDGTKLAAAAFNGWLHIIEINSDPELRHKVKIQRNIPNIMFVRFRDDGKRLIAADSMGKIMFIDPATGKDVPGEGPINLPNDAGRINSLEFAPRNNSLAIATRDGKVRVYNSMGNLFRELNTGRIFQLRFSPDGRFLALGSRDGSVVLRDLQATDEKREVAKFLNKAAVVDLQFQSSETGLTLVTMSAASMLHKWDVPPERKSPVTSSGQQVATFSFNPFTNAVAWSNVGSENICLSNLPDHKSDTKTLFSLPGVPCTLSIHPTNRRQNVQVMDIARLRFNRLGSTLAGLGWDRTAAIWDRNGRKKATLRIDDRIEISPPFSAISFSPDHRFVTFVARGESKGAFVLCDQKRIKNNNITCTIPRILDKKDSNDPDLTGAHFLNHPWKGWPLLVLTKANGKLCLGELQEKNTQGSNGDLELSISPCIDIPSGQGELSVASNDAWIGLAGTDGTLYLWERQQGNFWERDRFPYRPANVKPIQVSAGPLIRVSFRTGKTPDSSYLAAVSLDGTASLWNLNGQQMAIFRDERGDRSGGYLGADFKQNGNILLWKLNGALREEKVEDLSMLIQRGCRWLESYREGARTPSEDKKKIRFCDHWSQKEKNR